MLNGNGLESTGSEEAASTENQTLIQKLINGLNDRAELSKSNESEPGAAQVMEQINAILRQSLEQLENKQFEGCVSSLIDASDFAYQQSSIPGFEELESISDQIDAVIRTVKKFSAGLSS